MSYAVIHMQKIKTGGIRGIQNHNERLKESKTNPDIDTTKTHLNKDLHGDDNRTYYNRVKDRIKELNLPKAVRKDAVTMCGFVCTSDKAFFDKLPQSEKDRFFKESHDFLKDRYGEKNVVASKVHYDEKTPHMHCYIIPVTKDNRLSAKNIFTRSELQKLQTEYHKHMNDKGFDLERGLSSDGKRKHLDTQEFKLQTKKEDIIKATETLSKASENTKGVLDKLNKVEAKRIPLVGYGVSTEDYSTLTTLAKKGHSKVLENTQLKAKVGALQEESDKMESKYKRISKENTKLAKENISLKRENTKLIKANTRLEKDYNLIINAVMNLKLSHEVIKEMNSIEKSEVKNKSHDYNMER